MNKNIIYLKETSSYDDILKNEHKKIPLLFKKLLFLHKNIFNIITKKKIEDIEVWIMPVKEKYNKSKLKDIIAKRLRNQENIYLVSNELKENKVLEIMDEQKQEYIIEEKIKKLLILKTLNYILSLGNKELENIELTILVNNTSNINLYLLEELSKQVKILKIVSLNIYKFKNIEEKLYNEYGIPIQFSNSYRKSLKKSELIINLDFNEFEINEYEIFNNAIIINCIKDNIKIKSRLFNGIVINSYDIEYKKELINKFKKIKIYENYTRLMLYASLIEKENIYKIYEKIQSDRVLVIGLIGNSGPINKKEFKNIYKKLDKNKKTE